MYHIAVCDDNEVYADKIKSLIYKYCAKQQVAADIQVYNSSESLRNEIEDRIQEGTAFSAGAFDVYFLDIEMPGISGMELASFIHSIQVHSLIIFVTSHLEYAVDSYQLSIFRYIPKSLLQERIPDTLSNAFHYLSLQEGKSFIYTASGKLLKIPYKEILYICKEGKNAIFYLQTGAGQFLSQEKIRCSLRQVYQELSKDDFIFIDRGCIVNISYIQGIKDNDLTLKNGIRLPISTTRLTETKKVIAHFWGKNL